MIDFLGNIPQFSTQSRKGLLKLYHTMSLKTYIRKQYVYKVGDVADSVYIVFEGEFMLSYSLPKLNKHEKVEKMLG